LPFSAPLTLIEAGRLKTFKNRNEVTNNRASNKVDFGFILVKIPPLSLIQLETCIINGQVKLLKACSSVKNQTHII